MIIPRIMEVTIPDITAATTATDAFTCPIRVVIVIDGRWHRYLNATVVAAFPASQTRSR
jgi:hypothetical protein